MSDQEGAYWLTGGTHRRVDHKRGEAQVIRRGEKFVPTEKEKRQNEGRLERVGPTSVSVPRVPWLEDDDG